MSTFALLWECFFSLLRILMRSMSLFTAWWQSFLLRKFPKPLINTNPNKKNLFQRFPNVKNSWLNYKKRRLIRILFTCHIAVTLIGQFAMRGCLCKLVNANCINWIFFFAALNGWFEKFLLVKIVFAFFWIIRYINTVL